MTLYAAVVTNVYPEQCITVWANKANITLLVDHLNREISDNVMVRPVDSFFPDGLVHADQAWLDATAAYLRGYHHSTSEV